MPLKNTRHRATQNNTDTPHWQREPATEYRIWGSGRERISKRDQTSMKHAEKVAPVAAAVSALATLVCCLPVGIAAAAATASLGAVVSNYRSWFLGASAILLVIGIVQLTRVQRACATRNRGSMVILAVSGTIVLLVALFPQVLAGLLADWLP